MAEEAEAPGGRVVVGVALGWRVVGVMEHASGAGGVGIRRRGAVGEDARLPLAVGVPREDLDVCPLGGFDDLAEVGDVVFPAAANRHGDDAFDYLLAYPAFEVEADGLGAAEAAGRSDDESLSATLRPGRVVAGAADVAHPLGQRVGVLIDPSAPNQRRVVVEVHFHAVGWVVRDQFVDDREAVRSYLRMRVAQAVGVVELGFGVVGFGADAPFGMFGREVGDAAVGDAPVRGVVHVQEDVREELELALVGVVADERQRVDAALDHQLRVQPRAIPNLMVGEVDVVQPALADVGGVQEHAAVADGVADGVDAEVEQLVNGLDVLPRSHRGFVEVDAGVASVGIEDDLVFLAHGMFLSWLGSCARRIAYRLRTRWA